MAQLASTIKPISEHEDDIIWIRYDEDPDNYYIVNDDDYHDSSDEEEYDEELDFDIEDVPVTVTEDVEEDWDEDTNIVKENQEVQSKQEDQ